VSGDIPSVGGAFRLAPLQGDWIGNRAGAQPADNLFAAAGVAGQAFNPQTISTVGGPPLPHTNQQPYLAMNFCIALSGIFPSRN
jgi:microcystin-dependent protein